MKLDFVEMSGFRGFRDKTRFELAAGFVVLCGRNGVGKSTVLDAVDFAVTGTINKFAVKNARGGGLDEHIWWIGEGAPVAHYVSVGFEDNTGEKFVVTRKRGAEQQTNRELLERLCHPSDLLSASPETLMQTTLIRDETIVALSVDLPEQARFAAVKAAIGGLMGQDYSGRTSAICKAAAAALDEQRDRLDKVRAELGRALTNITEARSVAERSADVAEALLVIDSIPTIRSSDPRERIDAARQMVIERKEALRQLEAARQQAEALVSEVVYFRSTESSKEYEANKKARANAHEQLEAANSKLAAATRAETAERESDAYAAHFVSLLAHGAQVGLQEGHCPLCDAVRSEVEFEAAIAKAHERLAGREQRLAAAGAATALAQGAVERARLAAVSAQQRVNEYENRRESLRSSLVAIRETYQKYGFESQEDDPKAAQLALLILQQEAVRLERAIFAIEASSAVDRVSFLESQAVALRDRIEKEAARLSEAERVVDIARQIDTAAKSVANQLLEEQFDTVMPLLKELYRRLRPHGEWTDIDSDFGGKVRGSLNFMVGGHNLQFLFSSGQRRAAGLAFLLAIHLSRPWCNWQSLLLDDPIQHIDDYRALNLVEVLSAIRKIGRQVIIAIEDPALAEVLCRRLRSSTGEMGSRFDLRIGKSGTAEIVDSRKIFPMPSRALRSA